MASPSDTDTDTGNGTGRPAHLPPRALAAGRTLITVHDELREALAAVRDAIAHGETHTVPRSLLDHCTAFCGAVTRHHTAEDATTFPALARDHPELAPVIDEIARDHQLIAEILRQVSDLATSAAAADRNRALGELDGLAAVLDSHFRWEEKRLVAALDRWRPITRSAAGLFGETEVATPADGDDRPATISSGKRDVHGRAAAE